MQELSLIGEHEGNGAGSNLGFMGNPSVLTLAGPHKGNDALNPWHSQDQANMTQSVNHFGYLLESFRKNLLGKIIFL